MKRLIDYIKSSFEEVTNKVTWPPYKELQKNTILVLVASLIIAVIIMGIDWGFSTMTQFIYE